MERAVTLQNIADRLGVSRVTVSLALRNHPKTSKATRLRVQKAAQEMGYQPNAMVSALMSHLSRGQELPRNQVIAFVTGFRKREGWKERRNIVRFHSGAEARAQALGYKLEEFWLDEPGMNGKRLSQILSARGILGVLLAPFEVDSRVADLRWEHFATVALGYTVLPAELDRVTPNFYEHMNLALRQVQSLGYQRIGLVLIPQNDKRAHGYYLSSFLGQQFHWRKRVCILPLIQEEKNIEEFKQWYGRYQPDVIITDNHPLEHWLREMGIRIPQDVGVLTLNKRSGFSLAGVDNMCEAIGEAAIEQIVHKIHSNLRGLSNHPRTINIDPDWIDGYSLKSPQ